MALGVAVSVLGLIASPAGARPLRLGFDDVAFEGAPAQQGAALRGATAVGAKFARLAVDWRSIAPAKPAAKFDPTDPADGGYDFAGLDAAVRATAASGLAIVLNVSRAPSWAEGPGRPAHAYAGAWRPDPAAFGDFATALARRYAGTFPDPQRLGRTLPRVVYYQAWNEPNLSLYLEPQWQRRTAVSPVTYRLMLNAFYAAVKSVDPRDQVLTAGTAPYGDRGFGKRMRPVRFLRTLLCLKGRRALRAQRCPHPAHADIVAHHPINAFRPDLSAAAPDDATTPDVGRISRVVRRALRAGTLLPPGPKPLWATELWWDSRPPVPRGYPPATQARWTEEGLYLLWRQRVDTVFLLRVDDSLPPPSESTGYGSGLFTVGGRAKPAFPAVRFPFVADRRRNGRVLVWGLAPTAGAVRIERRRGHGWRAITTLRAKAGTPFQRLLHLRGRPRLRARSGAVASLPWHVEASRLFGSS